MAIQTLKRQRYCGNASMLIEVLSPIQPLNCLLPVSNLVANPTLNIATLPMNSLYYYNTLLLPKLFFPASPSLSNGNIHLLWIWQCTVGSGSKRRATRGPNTFCSQVVSDMFRGCTHTCKVQLGQYKATLLIVVFTFDMFKLSHHFVKKSTSTLSSL